MVKPTLFNEALTEDIYFTLWRTVSQFSLAKNIPFYRHTSFSGRNRHSVLDEVLHHFARSRLGRHGTPNSHLHYIHRLRRIVLSEARVTQVRGLSIRFLKQV